MSRGVAGLMVAGFLGLVWAGCATRDHTNPLDPENPSTSGEPQWLTSLADDGAVDLRWQVFVFRDVEEVRVIDTINTALLWSGRVQPGTFRDDQLPNGVDRRYRIDLVLENGKVLHLPETVATPGTAVPWAVDFGTGSVSRLTPDGRGRRDFTVLPDAAVVVTDPDSAFALVMEFFGGRIRLLDRDGETVWSRGGMGRPSGALHAPDGWWGTDAGAGTVFRLNDAGNIVYADSSFRFPGDLAPADSEAVWVVDRNGSVGRLERDQGVTQTIPFVEPLVAAAAPGGGLWVHDTGAHVLVRIDAEGRESKRFYGWERVDDLETDPMLPGGVWVADRAGQRVVLLDGEGNVVRHLGFFPSPSSLSVSPDGREVWVADPAVGEVVRMSREGLELARTSGMGSPFSVSVAFRPLF